MDKDPRERQEPTVAGRVILSGFGPRFHHLTPSWWFQATMGPWHHAGMTDVARRTRLLVVDDEPDMLDFIERATRRSYEVVRCQNGEDALKVLATSRFDLMVTDHKMPRLTGLELLDRIGALYPDMTRVLLSGYAELPDVQRAAATGRVHHYVVKPVDSQTLLAGLAHAKSVHGGATRFDSGA